MAFYLVQAGSSLKVLRSDFTTYATLTPPTGVTIRSDRPCRFANVANRTIISNAPTETLWLDPGTFTLYRLGVNRPFTAPAVAAGSGTGLTGSYSVKVTFVTKIGGVLYNESPASAASNTVSLSNKSLAVSSIPVSLDSSVTGRRLYRTVANGSEYLHWSDIDDNVTTVLDDNTADASLGDAIPDLGNAEAGSGGGSALKLLTEWRDRVWGIGDTPATIDHIVYSEAEIPYSFPPENLLLAQSVGEDSTGGTAFLRRRDELGIGKRNRIMKVIGDSNTNFEIIIVSEQTGVLASDSVIIVRDIAYFLGTDGIYSFGPQGVTALSRDFVDPWFLTDTYFNRGVFSSAFAGYNAYRDTYDLYLASAGQSTIDRWVSYHITENRFSGPHRTAALTPTARAMFRDTNGAYLPVVGGSDGFLYTMNGSGAADFAGSAPSTPIAIAIDWITKFLNGGAPDQTKYWGMPTFFLKKQGNSAGSITITPRVGDLEATDGTAQSLSQQGSRVRMPIWGAGRFLRLQFTHNTAQEDVEIYSAEQPIIPIGRR